MRSVGIWKFKANIKAVLQKIGRKGAILTVRGKPRAIVRKISERDLVVIP
ncbi:MAG: hypothetical protein HY600_03490 [Candidatus Omnitrophica bacterium]|nr:hypothetical protein [Candidatus Omnitrophota bacterium]